MITAKGEATRHRIVLGAAEQIREFGVDVTLDDVRARTGTSKGQLFHYFPDGKDELLIAVAEHEAARVLEDQQPHLGRLDDWASWAEWREAVVRRYRAQGTGCPLAVLMNSVGRSDRTRRITTALIEDWRAALTAGIRSMKASGRVAASVDAEESGRALVAAIQGGVAILLATGRIDYLESALDRTLAGLGAPTP